jgi:hypothetical protein
MTPERESLRELIAKEFAFALGQSWENTINKKECFKHAIQITQIVNDEIVTLQADLKAAREEIERLTSELDIWQGKAISHANDSSNATTKCIEYQQIVEELRDEIAVLKAEREAVLLVRNKGGSVLF